MLSTNYADSLILQILKTMKVLSYSAITKPGLLFFLPELSIFSLHLTQFHPCIKISNLLEKKNWPRAGIRCSISERLYVSTSVEPSLGRSDRSDRSSCLYSRPSLHEMRQERMADRTRVYEFLRGLGIVPDELDGLELPVSVDVMKERVDFLHKLGLTIQDINYYPLVLGCSVKKNMVPVLDYLGKLGVRKSTFTEFLHRYPQVLHSSVIIDLQPVVNYLQGMDIKQNDIPRVLERYPEVLGFKLEGTMSTSVAYLVGIGVARREIGDILTRYPEILGMRVGKVIKPFVEFLESIGVPRLAVAKLIERMPHILGFSLDDHVKPNVELLLEFGVREHAIPSIVALYPEILGIELESKLLSQQNLFNSFIDVGSKDFGKIVEKMPQVVILNQASMKEHTDFLLECGFSLQDVKKMVLGCPQLLALNLDIMQLSFDYFLSEMGRELDDLIEFPAFFTYSLESKVKPRHWMIDRKGLKCSLAWLLNCSDEKFEERLGYDSIEIEEMEMEPSFDMQNLLEPRRDESEDEDDSQDEYI